MRAVVDLTGKKFGRLLVVSQSTTSSPLKWNCVCDCGKTSVVEGGKLKSGHTKSCGCLKHEEARERMTKHGRRHTRIYRIWCAMKDRCARQKHYFDRGITVCDEWLNDFQAFYDWAISHGYADDLTIDRIDVNGNYCPENCRWATTKEQQNNTRKNRLITYNGETNTLSEWAEKLEINYSTLRSRLNRDHMTFEEAIRKG
jgi:hypothetical protein